MRGRAGADSGQSPRPLTPTLSPLKRGEGDLRLPSPLVSGRGFHLFRGLLRNLRAIVACRGGAASPLPAQAGRGGPAPLESARFRAQIQSFQSHAKDFPGDRRLPGRRSVLLPVHGEKVRMRGRAGADSGRSPRPLTPTLSPLKRGEGVLRLPSPLVSGRGFNLFRALRRISRAIGSQPRGWRSRGARALDASPDRYLPGQSLRVAHDGVAPTISCSRWNFASRAARASVDGSHRAA
jgi:hypothetical protein